MIDYSINDYGDGVRFDVECLPEDASIEGNVQASGDDEADREAEDAVRDDLNNGNPWAWCCVRVTAHYKGFRGTDYLGCCSYRSEEDFLNDAYYQDMCNVAFQELLHNLEGAAEALAELKG